MIARAAAVVAADGLADGRRIGIGVLARAAPCAVSSMPGVQKPHWSAFSARNACWRSAIAPLSATPSIVSTRQPSAWAASIRQPRIGVPSTRTVHAPHTPCSQPDVRAGEPEVVAEKVDQVLAPLDVARHRRAVDGQRDLHDRPPRAGPRRARAARGPDAGAGPASRGCRRADRGRRRAPGRPRRAPPRPRAGRPARPRQRRARTGLVPTPKNTSRASAHRSRRSSAPRTRGQAREGEVAVAARQLLEPPAPSGGGARHRIAVTISPGSSAVV